MATLQQLQKAIDQRSLDTRALSKEQLGALDQAFKEGELKGYDSIKDYSKIIDLASKSVAFEKEKRLKGFTAATGIERGNLVAIGAASFAAVPYLKEKDVIVDAFKNYGMKTVYGIDTRFNTLGEIYKNRFTVLGDQIKKLPNIRGPIGAPIRMLGNVASMLDNTVDFLDKLRKYGPTPALALEGKSAMAGAAGAFTGSSLYEVANVGSDFTGAMSADIANLTDNDIRKLPFAQRLLYNGLSEAYNDLLWTSGALGLVASSRYAIKSGVKNMLGLNTEESKEIARAFARKGMDPVVVHLIPDNGKGIKGVFQRFFKKFFTTIGVYPLVSGPLNKYNKEFNQKLTQEQFLKLTRDLDLAPQAYNSIMNFAGAGQIKSEWRNTQNTIATMYENFRNIYQGIGNPRMVPIKNIVEESKRIRAAYLEQFGELGREKLASLSRGERELTQIDDSMLEFLRYIERLGEKGDYVQLSELNALTRMNTNAYTNTTFKDVSGTQIGFRLALERDLNSLSEATVRSNLKDKIFKDAYEQELKANGPEAAEAFLDNQLSKAQLAFQALLEANAYNSLALRPFQKYYVGRKLTGIDTKLFSDAGINITGVELMPPGQLFDKVIRRVLDSGDPSAIRQLKEIMGVEKKFAPIIDEATGTLKKTIEIPASKEAKTMYDRYVRSYIWDAWNNATTNKLPEARTLSDLYIATEAARKGLVDKRAFILKNGNAEQTIRAMAKTGDTIALQEISPRIFDESTIADISDSALKNHNFGEVDLVKFVKNLGLDKKEGIEAFKEIFGGGAAGQKAFDTVEDILKMKSAIDGVPYRDPSTFVQRSITLRSGQAGGIAASATAAAFGIGSTLKLILGSALFADQILVNPKLAANLMELKKYERFYTGELRPEVAPKAMRTFARFINGMMEAEGDDFRIDPNKIDFKEVQQKIKSLSNKLPLNNEYDFNTMPKATRDRIYPEFDASKKITPEMARAGEEYLKGSNLMGLSSEQVQAIGNSNPLMQATEPQAISQAVQPTQPTAPQQMATQPMPQDTGQQAATYAALFPQDTLGQAVAARQFNKGGFVEDIYAQADEVLNG